MAQVNRPATVAGIKVLIPRRQGDEGQDMPLTLLTLLVVPPTPFKPVVEAKGYGPIPRRHDIPSPNLLLTLLPTTQKPFKPDLLARPYGPILTRQDLYAPENMTLTLLPTTQKPFKPFEWPSVPKSAAPRFAEAFENLLLATLASAAPAAPFKPSCDDGQQRWGVSQPRMMEATQNLLLTLLVAPAAPFVPDEWVSVSRPVPVRMMEPSQNRLLDLLPLTPAPMVPIEWAPAHRASWRIAEQTENVLLTLLTAPAVPMPFDTMEWSRPVVTPLRASQPEPLNLSLYFQPAPFCAQEWMVMPVRRATRPSESYTNTILKTLQQPKPFVNYDWVANAKTRTRYAPHHDANLSMTVLFGLNPVGEPYLRPLAAERPFQFDSKVRTMKFPAKHRRFSLE